MSNVVSLDSLNTGDVLIIGRLASIQFAAKPFLFRFVKVLRHDHLSVWVWLDGYQLKKTGDAVERREIFVIITGLHIHTPAPKKVVIPAQKGPHHVRQSKEHA